MNKLLVIAGIFILTASQGGCLSAERHTRPAPPVVATPPAGVFQMPVINPTILSRYGQRGARMHTGLDLRGRRGGGDPVLASRAGRVTYAGRFSSYGNFVAIEHGDGYITRYAHLKSISVRKGQKVKAGVSLGTVGRTGRATTEHLHFEILTPKFRHVDPYPYLFPSK